MTKRSYIALFLLLLLIKIVASLIIVNITGNQFFGGGNDSDYYHAYAIGKDNFAVNIWPEILRWLNNYNLYSRPAVTSILTFLGIIVIPFLTAHLTLKNYPKNYFIRKDYWIIALIVALYPTLYYQTTDMYREVFMLFLYIFFLYNCKSLSKRRSLITFILGIAISLLLYKFRPYLGAACFVTLILGPFYNYKKYSITLVLVLYLSLLIFLYHLGLLDRITHTYRELFNSMEGGSNIGIRFSDTTSFLPKFSLNWLYQMFGFYLKNKPSIFVFFTESILFIYGLIFVIKNKKYSDKFINYLIIFFIAYATIWLLGNDNLGTATRLRMFNYLVILIAYFTIKNNKRLLRENNG